MRLWPFTLSLLVTVYSGWLGLLAAAVDVLLLLRSEVLRTQRVRIAGAIAVAVVTPMALTALSYASVVGGRGLLDYLLSRLVHRSSLGPAASGWQGVWQVLENFRTGFLPVMVVLLAALPFVLRGWWDGVLRLTPRVKVLLVLTGLPVLLEHMLLLDYAAHDFVALKATPLLVAAVALLLEGAARQPWRMRMPGTVLVLVLCAAGAAYFRHINAPGGSAVHRDRGTFVAQHIRPEERFFWSGPSPEPQLVWYAQRTPWSVRNVEEAREALARHGEARGVLFRPSPDGSGLEAIRVVP
jgi:hypothetical protein